MFYNCTSLYNSSEVYKALMPLLIKNNRNLVLYIWSIIVSGNICFYYIPKQKFKNSIKLKCHLYWAGDHWYLRSITTSDAGLTLRLTFWQPSPPPRLQAYHVILLDVCFAFFLCFTSHLLWPAPVSFSCSCSCQI